MNYKFKNFPATCVLIGINVAIYLLMTFAGGSQNPGVLSKFRTVCFQWRVLAVVDSNVPAHRSGAFGIEYADAVFYRCFA